MEFSEEWKSFWPISSSHAPRNLFQTSSSSSSTLLGPLIFNPIPESLTLLFASPSNLSPPFLPPPPHLSLSRFIQTTTSHDSPVFPTTASAISASFGPQHPRICYTGLHNRLEPLLCPNNQALIFFPTGVNLDCIGFLVLSVKDSNLTVDFSDGSIFTSNIKFDHRIVRISACPVSAWSSPGVGSFSHVGFVLASGLYAVHWFTVKVRVRGSDCEKPSLVYLGSKLFKSCAVAHACWNPHLPDESVVLLESGELFLFDMNSSCSNARFRGKRISVLWGELGELARSGWFCCEFSWHPRILVVANSKAIYLVDFRFDKCQTSCLLKIDMLGIDDMIDKDRFVAYSKAGSDGFFYTVASKRWLLLCDIRKPLMPVLKWTHNVHEAHYMTVLPLSDLRSHPYDEKYSGVSKMGFAVILGSLWNNDFSVFCYGNSPLATTQSISTKISNFSNSFYAWELPSHLSLCSQKCLCGSCLLKEEIAKDDLPEWIEWQQKKDLILGFFILNKDLSSLLPKQGEHGGFILIRLMSSGKLEAQQYCASWEPTRIAPTSHEQMAPHPKDSLLCSMGDDKYKFPRRFKYLKLEYLYSYLNDNLSKVLFAKFKTSPGIASRKRCFDEHLLQFISENVKPLGCDAFKDVKMPISVYEIACRVMWTMLPTNILEVGFSNYSEVIGVLLDHKKVSLEFPVIPYQNQLPPFFFRNPSRRSIKWSSKVKPSSDIVGPVVPLPALLVLSEIYKHGHSFVGKVNEFSPEEEFSSQCKSVMHLAKDMGVLNSSIEHDKEHAVSLEDDKEDTWVGSLNPSPFFMYEPSAFTDELSVEKSERFNVVIAKFPENEGVIKGINMDGMEYFDDLCPVELPFDYHDQKFTDEELKAYKLLKSQFSQWQNGFIPYQNFCMQLKSK